MKKRIVSLFAVFCLFLSFGGCGTQKSAEAVLGEVLAVSELPRGVVYSMGNADEALLTEFYGDGAPDEFALLSSYAIYSSARMEVCEVAIFCCYAASDAHRIAEMCHSRADILQKHFNITGEERPLTVLVRGKWVIMAACENADEVARRAGKLL